MVIVKTISYFFAALGAFLGFNHAPSYVYVPGSPTFLSPSFKNYTIDQFCDYSGASVLPMGYLTTPTGRDLYIVLGREFYGIDKGTYDDWGGARIKSEINPIDTAAREMCEEAISNSTMSLNGSQIKNYIGLQEQHTKHILVEWFVGRSSGAIRPYITFVTEFDQIYLNGLIDKFYKARSWSFQSKYLEKDRIALVSYNVFLQAIKTSQPEMYTQVGAQVINPDTKELEKRTITLRPFLVKRMQKFVDGEQPKNGIDKRIRIYEFIT